MNKPQIDEVKELMAMYNSACEEPPLEPPDADQPPKSGDDDAADADKAHRGDSAKGQWEPKLLFGRQFRNRSNLGEGEIPRQLCPRPERVHVDSLVIERLSDVESLPLNWLWPGRIPRGRLTLLAGDPGIGKSLVALDLAARVSRGGRWPDESRTADRPPGNHPKEDECPGENCPDAKRPEEEGRARQPANVLVFSMEDDLRDTIRPRLLRAHADPERAFVAEGVYNPAPFRDLRVRRRFRFPNDIGSLSLAITELWPLHLIVFDPITAYCGSSDGSAVGLVHSILAELIDLAAKTDVAIIGTTHLRKGSIEKAIHRAAGSLDFTTAARAVWMISRDADDPARRIMTPAKMNLAPHIEGLAFRIDGNEGVVWDEKAIPMTADRMFEAETFGKKVAAAKHWLSSVLAEGTQPARAILQLAREYGFLHATVQRAREELEIIVRRTGFGAGSRSTWTLPETAPLRRNVSGEDLISMERSDIYGEIPDDFS